MTKPVRLQLSRRKGFNLQALSLATNGLPAVNCARPTLYSNPFPIGKPSGYLFKDGGDPTPLIPELTREKAIEFYRDMYRGYLCPEMHPWGHEWRDHLNREIGGYYPFSWIESQLRGKNLACYCSLSDACHCDFLLAKANGWKCEETT